MMGGQLLENEGLRALGSPKVSETGLQGHGASLPPCVAAMWSLVVVGKGMSSCHFESQGMVPLTMWDARPNVAVVCLSTAMLPFTSEKMASGRIANVVMIHPNFSHPHRTPSSSPYPSPSNHYH